MDALVLMLALALPAQAPEASQAPSASPSPEPCPDLSTVDPEKDVVAPRKTKTVSPVYPKAARDAGKGGKVVIEVTITPSGSTRDHRVKTSIDPDLDKAALEAVKQWEYTPAYVLGKPCPVIMDVTVNFVPGPTPAPSASPTAPPKE